MLSSSNLGYIRIHILKYTGFYTLTYPSDQPNHLLRNNTVYHRVFDRRMLYVRTDTPDYYRHIIMMKLVSVLPKRSQHVLNLCLEDSSVHWLRYLDRAIIVP
jgi:hypothetical protein